MLPFGNPYQRPKKVVDAVYAATSFIGTAMERSKPLYLVTIAEEENEETRSSISRNAT
jgi:hypothetical protein